LSCGGILVVAVVQTYILHDRDASAGVAGSFMRKMMVNNCRTGSLLAALLQANNAMVCRKITILFNRGGIFAYYGVSPWCWWFRVQAEE